MKYLLPLIAAASAVAAPVAALAIDADADTLFLHSGTVPAGFDKMVDARFTVDSDQTRFVLSGRAFQRPLAGVCQEAVAADGSASAACQYGAEGQEPTISLLVGWAPHEARAKGSLVADGREITFERVAGSADGTRWTFKANGRRIASMDDQGVEMHRRTSSQLAEDITAAAFILRQIS
jgi:porphobilinogen deaminase